MGYALTQDLINGWRQDFGHQVTSAGHTAQIKLQKEGVTLDLVMVFCQLWGDQVNHADHFTAVFIPDEYPVR